jgi:hypothetical protein
MKALKIVSLVIVLVSAAALSIFVYWNSEFYDRAQRETNVARKIAYLEKSNRSCPLNDLVFYELGKARLDLALERAGDPGASSTQLRQAILNLERALDINPYSPYAHFYLGQALLQSQLLAPVGGSRLNDEFRKAALLAGNDHHITDQAARFFFSRWQRLAARDRRFTLELVREIMSRKDAAQVNGLLSAWELNIGDPAVIDGVLPKDAQVYRMYAGFLGERSLLPEERRKYLAAAERLEFGQAQAELQSGEYALFRSQIAQARDHLSRALALIRGIRFYQVFLPKSLISDADFDDLEKAATLGLAKCRIEERAKLEDVEQELLRYLELEEGPQQVADLEAYLRTRGILPEERGQGFDDLGRLALELQLQFRQARYRDIVSLGRTLQKSLVVVPDEKKKDYVRVLRIIGDALQKVDFIYDAGDTYRRALDIDPEPLGTLTRLRENYKRLNDAGKLKQVEENIRKVESPGIIDLGSQVILRGGLFTRSMTFGGEMVALELRLKIDEPALSPVVAVFFNNRVVWEEPPTGEIISLSGLETRPGDNLLQVSPLNRAISLVDISWRPANLVTGPALPPVRSTH